ncbi:MAG: DUF4397 domain-containing protein [Gemmatimonadaceae bacterium]
MEWSMRRLSLTSLLVFAALLTACAGLTEEFPTAAPQVAGVRFINAVPDTAGAYGMDLRFVDIVENNAHFRQNFRNGPTASSQRYPCTEAIITGTSSPCPSSASSYSTVGSIGVQYKPAQAGQRRFRIFLDDSLQANAQIVIKDTTVTLQAGKNYTALLMGQVRAGASPSLKLLFFEEVEANPATQVTMRVINTSYAAIDVRRYKQGSSAPATATWENVAPMSVSTYSAVDTGVYRYNVQPAGGGTALFADGYFLVGQVAYSTAGAGGKIDIEALPGTAAPGSVVTLIVFPPSTAGARTPQTSAFQVPAATTIWDRRPPYVNP